MAGKTIAVPQKVNSRESVLEADSHMVIRHRWPDVEKIEVPYRDFLQK